MLRIFREPFVERFDLRRRDFLAEREGRQFILGRFAERRFGLLGGQLFENRRAFGGRVGHCQLRQAGKQGDFRPIGLLRIQNLDFIEQFLRFDGLAESESSPRRSSVSNFARAAGEMAFSSRHFSASDNDGLIELFGQHGLDELDPVLDARPLGLQHIDHLGGQHVLGGQGERFFPRFEGLVELPKLILRLSEQQE